MEIDRRILVFDGADGALQQLALELIGREFEVHYANDIDEAQILVRETGGRINAILVSTSDAIPPVPELIRRFAVSPAALIPIGPRPADRVVEAMRFHGVRWHLWDDPPDESIRLIVANVLFEQDPLELRFHLRVPTSLPAQIEIANAKCDTTIRDLSLGGACLLGANSGAEGDEGILRFVDQDEEMALPIRIAWAVGDASDPLRILGVNFLELSMDAGAVIDRLIESVIGRHRIADFV